jgi:hypothetical protein
LLEEFWLRGFQRVELLKLLVFQHPLSLTPAGSDEKSSLAKKNRISGVDLHKY